MTKFDLLVDSDIQEKAKLNLLKLKCFQVARSEARVASSGPSRPTVALASGGQLRLQQR